MIWYLVVVWTLHGTPAYSLLVPEQSQELCVSVQSNVTEFRGLLSPVVPTSIKFDAMQATCRKGG